MATPGSPLLVCGCQPPDTLCERGQQIVALIRRHTMALNQFGQNSDTVTLRNQALGDWAHHIYQDHASAVTLLPRATV